MPKAHPVKQAAIHAMGQLYSRYLDNACRLSLVEGPHSRDFMKCLKICKDLETGLNAVHAAMSREEFPS